MDHVHDSQETTPAEAAWINLCEGIGPKNANLIGKWFHEALKVREAAKQEPPKPRTEANAGMFAGLPKVKRTGSVEKIAAEIVAEHAQPQPSNMIRDNIIYGGGIRLGVAQPQPQPESGAEVPEWCVAIADDVLEKDGRIYLTSRSIASLIHNAAESDLARRVAEAKRVNDEWASEVSTLQSVLKSEIGSDGSVYRTTIDEAVAVLRHWKQQLAAKDKRIAELEAKFETQTKCAQNYANEAASLKQQLAAAQAEVERLAAQCENAADICAEQVEAARKEVADEAMEGVQACCQNAVRAQAAMFEKMSQVKKVEDERDSLKLANDELRKANTGNLEQLTKLRAEVERLTKERDGRVDELQRERIQSCEYQTKLREENARLTRPVVKAMVIHTAAGELRAVQECDYIAERNAREAAERERDADVSAMEAAAKLLYIQHGKRGSLAGECDGCDAWELLNKRIAAYRAEKGKVQQ